MGKYIVILGARGFIGQETVRFLLQKRMDLFLIARHAGCVEGIPVHPVNLERKGALRQALRRRHIRALVYLSASIPQRIEDANRRIYARNMAMHEEVLSSWRALGCQLVYASSGSVYTADTQLPWREDAFVVPDNWYSFSKLAGELFFLKEQSSLKYPLTILRLNAPYGYRKEHKSVVNIFIEQALAQKPITVFGSGKREQDFLYVGDAAHAIWRAIQAAQTGIFNIASGRSVSMNKLALMIKALTKSSSRMIIGKTFDPLESQRVIFNVRKAHRVLGFSAQSSLKEGLRECIKRYNEETR